MAGKDTTATMAGVYRNVRSKFPDDLSAGGVVRAYEDFVSKNSSSVSQIESALRSLTYIIPGRFREAELASESLHAGIQLLSMYHDSLLSRVFAQIPPTIPRPIASPHNRYTQFWCGRSRSYKRIARLLQTLQYTELLCEMLAKRRGERTRWRTVVSLEFVKAVCRFLLLRLTRSRPLVSPPLPERESDPRAIQEKADDTQWDGMATPPVEEDHCDLAWTMPRTGLTLPALPESGEVVDYLLKKVLTADDVKAPRQLLHRLTTSQAQLAEIIWILRPLLYALLLQKYQNNKKSWTPWLVGVATELASRQLTRNDLSERLAGGLRGLTSLEKEQYKMRGSGLSWWLMRGVFYEQITRGWIRGAANSLRGKPLLDIVGGIIDEYEFLWNEYYFSTSTM